MEFIIFVFATLIVLWLWKARKLDKQTNLDFDVWIYHYENSASPLERARMSAAYLTQSAHMALKMGVLKTDREHQVLLSIFKRQGASISLASLLGTAMPVVTRVVRQQDIANASARVIGAFMLLVWLTEPEHREAALIQYLSKSGFAY
ncbi:hypothetical protein Meth11DRAFT_1993 [Methylophilaceae bacterium 11]|nr:hypothetical protein Meth11DRAFT_1993 [Methylophilaceae bacterium 11]